MRFRHLDFICENSNMQMMIVRSQFALFSFRLLLHRRVVMLKCNIQLKNMRYSYYFDPTMNLSAASQTIAK